MQITVHQVDMCLGMHDADAHQQSITRQLFPLMTPQVYVPMGDLLWRDVTVRGFWLNLVSMTSPVWLAGACAHV